MQQETSALIADDRDLMAGECFFAEQTNTLVRERMPGATGIGGTQDFEPFLAGKMITHMWLNKEERKTTREVIGMRTDPRIGRILILPAAQKNPASVAGAAAAASGFFLLLNAPSL